MISAKENGTTLTKKDSFTKIETIGIAKKALEFVISSEKIKSAFQCTGIEPFDPQSAIKRIGMKKESSVELSNKDLQELLKPTIIIQKPESKGKGKRVLISNKIATSSELMETLKKKQEEAKEKESRKKKRQKKKMNFPKFQ